MCTFVQAIQDLLAATPAASDLTVTDMYQVCSSYVYILDSVIWPSTDPTQVPSTNLASEDLPPIW